jgi:serine/threonine protein kinase
VTEERQYQGWADDDGEDLTEVVAALEPGTFYAERFRVDGRLGMGAMGKVVTAFDSITNQRVALKVLHRERAAQREAVERFAREAEVLARLGHPGIVRVVGSDRTRDGARWLAMELIEGDTLTQRIKKGALPPVDAYRIINVLCDALDAAHREGIVHRDLKPDNIMIPASGEPACKILDFGLARINELRAERLTRAGTILGTPRYMAPELIKTLRDTDHRADVFAVGAITFELLTGKSIYAADDVGQLFGAIIEGRTRKLRELAPHLPESLEQVIIRSTALDPAVRQQTAGAFAESYAGAIGVPSMRSQLDGAHEMFDPEASTTLDEQAGAPLVDPYAPSLSLRPPRMPSMEPTAPRPMSRPALVDPPVNRAPIVVIAPMRTVSDRPGGPAKAASVPTPQLRPSLGSAKATVEGVAPAPGRPYLSRAPSERPPAPLAVTAAPMGGQHPMPQPMPAPMPRPLSEPPPSYGHPVPDPGFEGGRPYSDRPPPYAGADQKAQSVYPPRARSFTPPLGVTRDPATAFPAPPVGPGAVPGGRRIRGWMIAVVVVVILLALVGGFALRWAVESGLLARLTG